MLALSSAFLFGIAGCGGAPSGESGPSGLRLGAQGQEVREVNDYLLDQGYFPNAELQEKFPEWVPAIAEGPAAQDVFDERTEQAVRAFQASVGLNASGVVDHETLDTMRRPQCGNPYHDPGAAGDKFHHNGGFPYPYGGSFTFSVTGNASGFSASTSAAFVQGAFNTWSGPAATTFSLTTGSSHAIVRFVPLPANVGGRTYGNLLGPRYLIEINNTVPFSGPLLANVLTHEVGHLLGFNHSSITSALMFPIASPTAPVLVEDDLATLTPAYRRWIVQDTPLARDVGVGANGKWLIGKSDSGAFGGGIFRRINNSTSWAQVDGQATRIAVGAVPWVVNNAGNIFRRLGVTTATPTGTSWQDVSNGAAAIDIGVGSGQNAWAISTTNINQFGNAILHFNGSTWDTIGGQAVRVAVGADDSVFVVNQTGQVYKRANVSPTNLAGTHWTQEPMLAPNVFGNETGFALDVGVAQTGIAWVIGTADGAPFSFLRNFQDATTGGGPPAVALARWVPLPGGGSNISAFNAHEPWGANSTGTVFARQK